MARRVRIVLLAVCAALLGPASTAAADTYLSLGIGGQAHLQGDAARALQGTGGRSGRLALGQRIGVVAIEAGIFGTGLGRSAGTVRGANLVSAAAELKLHLPLSAGLELYGKGGLNHGWVTVNGEGVIDQGEGVAFGAGIQYRITPGPMGSAAIWLDYTHQEVALGSGTTAVDIANIGVSVGL